MMTSDDYDDMKYCGAYYFPNLHRDPPGPDLWVDFALRDSYHKIKQMRCKGENLLIFSFLYDSSFQLSTFLRLYPRLVTALPRNWATHLIIV